MLKKDKVLPNRSKFLPALLDQLGGTGLNPHRRKLCDEAIKLTSPVFAPPKPDDLAPSPRIYSEYGRGGVSGADDDRREGEFTRQDLDQLCELRDALLYLEAQARSQKTPNPMKTQYLRAYGTCVQACLEHYGIHCPAGVFKNYFQAVGRGRKPSRLGLNAALLHEPGKFGDTRIAKKLIPVEAKEDYATAAKKIRKAKRPWTTPF